VRAPEITISVVSHEHGEEIPHFLSDLAAFASASVSEVIVTLNVPEGHLSQWIEARDWPFKLTIINNKAPLGYGANHNQAFGYCSSKYFCVVNPDIRLPRDPFPALVKEFRNRSVGCVYPLHMNGDRVPRNHSREIPGLRALIRRYGIRNHRKAPSGDEWVNGAFLLFPAEVYQELGGFDTKFFMYCEDVDICLRLALSGYLLKVCQSTTVEHEARHASRRKMSHLVWHIESLWILWNSSVYREYKSKRAKGTLPVKILDEEKYRLASRW